MQQKRSDTGRDSVETPGVDLRTRVKSLGVKKRARRKKCKVRFSLLACQEDQGLPKELREGTISAKIITVLTRYRPIVLELI